MKKVLKKVFHSNRLFSNVLIVFCVVYMAVYLQECLLVQGKTAADPASLAKVAGAFFGGELLMICLAYRFGQRKKTQEEETV